MPYNEKALTGKMSQEFRPQEAFNEPISMSQPKIKPQEYNLIELLKSMDEVAAILKEQADIHKANAILLGINPPLEDQKREDPINSSLASHLSNILNHLKQSLDRITEVNAKVRNLLGNP